MAASFSATIRYDCLALALLVVAGLAMDVKGAAIAGLMATGAAYLSHTIYTQSEEGSELFKIGVGFQLASLALWAIGLLVLVRS